MNILYNWLKELVPDLHLPPGELAQLLTMHSFETVVAREIAIDPNVTVVKITRIEPHPNADRLKLATIDLGKPFDFAQGKQEITVVCGAQNITVGQLVPYSPPGAEVYDEHGEVFVVKEAKIRGVASPGMLNSLRELGLAETHAGIWVLPANTLVGSKLAQHMPADVILEADITPNRAHDCLSMVGIAREVGALLNLAVVEPAIAKLPSLKSTVDGFSLDIADTKLTPRYMNVLLKEIKNGETPLWLQVRLLVMGSRPISSIVDVTNYVMFELGNPCHAFDALRLPGKTTGVRLSRGRERLKLLDSSELKVAAGTLVITSDDAPVALAGIMGGAGTEVEEKTSELLLEIANFQPQIIQQAAAKLHLRTEAAARFLKGIDPNLVQVAASRATHLLEEITGAKIIGVLDNYPHPRISPAISFHPARVSIVAGVRIELEQVKDILERLRCNFSPSSEGQLEGVAGVWRVTPPTDRLDLEGEHDLIEEVVRIVGLEKIPAADVVAARNPVPLPPQVAAREAVRDALVAQGFTETYNYSFAGSGSLEIVNPVSPEQKWLRESLLPGLLANFVKNKAEFTRKSSKVNPALFEIGHVYVAGKGGQVEGVVEKQYLAGMVEGDEEAIEQVLLNLTPTLSLPTEQAGLVRRGEVSSDALRQTKLPGPVAYFEVDLDALIATMPAKETSVRALEEIRARAESPVQFTELPKYPAAYRDISVLVRADVTVETIQELIERAGGQLVVDSDLFDEYDVTEDSQDAHPNTKSLAFHIQYQSPERTLTDDEVHAVHTKIEEALKQELGASVR